MDDVIGVSIMDQLTLYDGIKTDPKMLVEMACAWIKDGYPRKDGHWMKLVNLVERECYEGAPIVRRGDLFRIAQEQGLSITECREFRFDNNIWSTLSRYLILFRPHLSKVIHPRKSDIDTIDLVKMWHDHVCDSTFFVADSWQQARKDYEACA